MSTSALVLIGSTFVLSALWAAVMLVLVRFRETEPGAGTRPAHMGVELAWAVIPIVVACAVILPALHAAWAGSLDAAPGDRVAEVAPAP